MHVSPRSRVHPARRVSLILAGAIVLLGGLVFLLLKPDRGRQSDAPTLVLFCAAGMRLPMEQIRQDFERECGVRVEVQYGGSNTLLSQLQVSRVADLYLAADDSYLEIARQKGLIEETLPIAAMVPVIVVPKGNPRAIHQMTDLLKPRLRVAIGNPDQAAIGKKTRFALTHAGSWDAIEAHVTADGVFKPTVPDVANTVLIGSVDAGIVWDATAAQYPDLEAISAPELQAGVSRITIGVTPWTSPSATALKFARYVTASDRGLATFTSMGYATGDGAPWREQPELTFFAGAVNRRALESVIKRFEEREGIRVNTIYNGCGILTAQMRTIRDHADPGFPDVYMACDVFYLDAVQELFQEGVRVSETDIVVAVARGNPKKITGLADLTRTGVRVAIGQPEQCTIGVLTRQLLSRAGLYEKILDANVVTQTPSSSMLVPAVTTGAADAALVYRTDTLAEDLRIDVISVDSTLAKAVQPFAVSRSTPYVQLADRLALTVLAAQDDFEAAGFRWRMPDGRPPLKEDSGR